MANSLYSVTIETRLGTSSVKSGAQEIIGVLNKIAAAGEQASKRASAIDAQQVKSAATAAREVEGTKLRSLRIVEQEELRLSRVRDQQRAYDLKKEEEQARRIANLQRNAAGQFISANAPPTIGRGGGTTSTGVTGGNFNQIETIRTLAAQDAMRSAISAGTVAIPTQHFQAGAQATQAYGAAQAQATQQVQGLTISNIALGAAIGGIVVQAFQEFVGMLKSAIVDSALYASRTEELGLALGAVANANHIATAEVLGQERAIEKLNITTQETRSTLVKMVIAQLDYTKATELATAAQDLAISSGMSTADELEALVRGITTMQSRVLRNAGVFTTAEEAEKKYAEQVHKTVSELTTQEKQTAVLNEVLLQGARATGAYDAAMGSASKQLRTLTGRVIPEAQNAFGTLLDLPLRAIVKTLLVLFETISKYPGAILIAALAATAAAAVVLIGAMGGLAAVAGSASIALTTLYDALVITALGLETTTGILVAGTAGWAAIAAVVGIAVYAIYKYTTAQKELPEVNERALATTRQLITAMKDDVTWFQNASGAVQEHGEFLGRLEGAFKRIDPVTAANIQRLKDEQVQRKLVVEALNSEIAARQREREVQISAVVEAGAASLGDYQKQIAQLDSLTKHRKELSDELVKFQGLGNAQAQSKIPEQFRGMSNDQYVAHLREVIDRTGVSVVKLSNDLSGNTPAFQANARHLADMAREAGQTAEEFLLCRSATNELSDSQRRFALRAQEMNDDLKRQADSAHTAAAAFESYQKAISDLKTPKLDVSQTVEGIKSRWQSLGEEFKLTFEGLAKVTDSDKWDAKTLAWGKSTDQFKETVRALGGAFNTLDKDTENVMGGGYLEFIKSQPKLVQEALRAAVALNAQAKSTKSLTEQAVDAVKKHDEATKKRQQDIASITSTLTSGIAAEKEKLAELTDGQGKGANASRDLAMWHEKLSEEHKNLIQELPQLTALYEQFTNAAKETTSAQKHVQFQTIIDEAQKFGGDLSLKLSDTPVKIDEVADSLEKLRKKFKDAGGSAVASAEDVAKFNLVMTANEEREVKFNLKEQSKAFDKTARSIAGLEIQLQSLTGGRQQTQLERFTQSLISIEGLNLKEDAFAGLVKAAEGIGKAEGATQALDALVTNVVNNASGVKLEDREATIKRITALLRGAAYFETASGQERARLGREHLSSQQALEVLGDAEIRQLQRKQSIESENADLQVRIAQTQDRIADGPYNQSLRIQLALIEDIAEFRRRDEEAMIAQNKAQIEISDQTVFHAEQARAQILDQFSRDKSVTQIWAEGFIGAADAVTTGISKVFDRITAKLGIFGSMIKQVLTDITKLAVDRVFRSLLDSILPGGGGGQQQQSSGSLPFFNLGGAPGQSTVSSALSLMGAGGISVPGSASASGGILGALKGLLGGGASGGAAGIGASLATTGPIALAAMAAGTTIAAFQGDVHGLQAFMGGGLLALFIGNWKYRQKQEKINNQAHLDTLPAVYEILFAAQRGELTVSAARAQFEQVHQDYLSKISGIKDSKTRRNALLWWDQIAGLAADPGGRTTAIWPLIEAAAKAGEAAGVAKQAFSPTFAQGGLVPWMGGDMTMIRVRPGERIDDAAGFSWHVPGVDRGVDSVTTVASPNSAVRTKGQQSQFPSFAGGSNATVAGSPRNVVINVPNAELAALLNFILGAIKTEEGGKIIVNHMSKDVRNNGTDGFMGELVRA